MRVDRVIGCKPKKRCGPLKDEMTATGRNGLSLVFVGFRGMNTKGGEAFTINLEKNVIFN
jgi:hypothetical protein